MKKNKNKEEIGDYSENIYKINVIRNKKDNTH